MGGDEAEDAALTLLRKRGLQLVARNYRCRGGELDLVMLDRQTLVVVEVRARSHRGFGSAIESVDARKQGRIILATQLFLASHPEHAQRAVRFDVVAFDACQVPEWLQNAFDAS